MTKVATIAENMPVFEKRFSTVEGKDQLKNITTPVASSSQPSAIRWTWPLNLDSFSAKITFTGPSRAVAERIATKSVGLGPASAMFSLNGSEKMGWHCTIGEAFLFPDVAKVNLGGKKLV